MIFTDYNTSCVVITSHQCLFCLGGNPKGTAFYLIFFSQSRQATIGGKNLVRSSISSSGLDLPQNWHLKVTSLVTFVSDFFFFTTSSVVIYLTITTISFFNLGNSFMGESDHAIASLVISFYLGISANDTLFKADTGTNFNTFP